MQVRFIFDELFMKEAQWESEWEGEVAVWEAAYWVGPKDFLDVGTPCATGC